MILLTNFWASAFYPTIYPTSRDPMAEPPDLMDPYEALRIIEVFVRVAEQSDSPDANRLLMREIRNVLTKATPKKPRRGRRPTA